MREPAEVISYDGNKLTVKELKSVLAEYAVPLPVTTQVKRVYVELLSELQARLVVAANNANGQKKQRSRSVPRKIDFTVESVDSPKLRAVGRIAHGGYRSHQKPLAAAAARSSRSATRQARPLQPSASRSLDDDENGAAHNDDAAGSSDDDSDSDLRRDDDDDDDDDEEDDDGARATVTPIVSTPIRSAPDRPDHGPTMLAVFVDFLLFLGVAAVVVLGGGNLLEKAFGKSA